MRKLICGGDGCESLLRRCGCSLLRTQLPLPRASLARAIIHNSDYSSLAHARQAIDRYFKERNEHFTEFPKRAGGKIWGLERVRSEFSEGHNCKAPGIERPGLL
jgi:hypothetical protein